MLTRVNKKPSTESGLSAAKQCAARIIAAQTGASRSKSCPYFSDTPQLAMQTTNCSAKNQAASALASFLNCASNPNSLNSDLPDVAIRNMRHHDVYYSVVRRSLMESLTQSQARELVARQLDAFPDYDDLGGCVILDEHTIERSWGWVFFYNSRKYVETNEFEHALLGNAPYIVNRFDGSMHVTGTARPTEHYIAEYESQIDDGLPNPSPHPR